MPKKRIRITSGLFWDYRLAAPGTGMVSPSGFPPDASGHRADSALYSQRPPDACFYPVLRRTDPGRDCRIYGSGRTADPLLPPDKARHHLVCNRPDLLRDHRRGFDHHYQALQTERRSQKADAYLIFCVFDRNGHRYFFE